MHFPKTIFVANVDIDDSLFFQLAINEICTDCTVAIFPECGDLLKRLFTGAEALPDLILLNINASSKSGLDCLLTIREHIRFMEIPIVVCSTTRIPEDVEKAYEYGANHYMIKHRTIEDMKKTILAYLNRDWTQGTISDLDTEDRLA